MLNVTNTEKAFSLQQDETYCSSKHNPGGHGTPTWKVHGWLLLQQGCFQIPKPPFFLFKVICLSGYLKLWKHGSHFTESWVWFFYKKFLNCLSVHIIIFARKRGAFCVLGSALVYKCCHSLLEMQLTKNVNSHNNLGQKIWCLSSQFPISC